MVASDVGSIGYVVNGEAGLIVPPGDVAALAAACRSILTDQRLAARFGAAGRARAEAVFAWPLQIERYRELFAGLAGRREPIARA